MAIQLVHTADVLLDASFAGTGVPGRHAPSRRRSRLDTFERIVRRAIEWPADALLITGNFLDQQRTSRDSLQRVNSLFKEMGNIPVLVTPGPRDPYVPHSPYVTESWPANVHFFTKPEWRSKVLGGGAWTVHGFGYDAPSPTRNPFASLRANGKGIQVAIGYGHYEGFVGRIEPGALPVTEPSLAQSGAAYVGLGGFPRFHSVEFGGVTVAYPGTPEARMMHETGMRHFAEITLTDSQDGVDVSVQQVPVAQTIYHSETVDCQDFETAEELLHAVRDISSEDGVREILHLRLTGGCAPAVHAAIPLLEDELGHVFDHLLIEDRTGPADDFDELKKQDTTLGDFVRRIQQELATTENEAQKLMLRRTLEVGVAAFRQENLPLRGVQAL